MDIQFPPRKHPNTLLGVQFAHFTRGIRLRIDVQLAAIVRLNCLRGSQHAAVCQDEVDRTRDSDLPIYGHIALDHVPAVCQVYI